MAECGVATAIKKSRERERENMMQSHIIDSTTDKRSSQIAVPSVIVGKHERDLMESQGAVYSYNKLRINARCDLKIQDMDGEMKLL